MTQVWFGCLTNDNNGIFRYHLLHSVFIKKPGFIYNCAKMRLRVGWFEQLLNLISREIIMISWLVVWNMLFFHLVGNNNPNWLIFFQRGRYTTNQYHMIERKYGIKLGDKTSFQRALGGGLARQSLVLATSPSLCSCACSTLRSRSDVGSCCCERFQKNRLELWSNIF